MLGMGQGPGSVKGSGRVQELMRTGALKRQEPGKVQELWMVKGV